MRNEDHIRILHMIDGIETAIQFLNGRKRSVLDDDRMVLFAVIRAIEIVGEAASKVTPETRKSLSEIPWRAITSMRNRLIHGYFDIDTEIVWKTVKSELPLLLLQLKAIAGT